MELLNKLGVDWRLLIAQLINFSVLLFVLYKFLYHPVLDMLAKRRRQIDENDTREKTLVEKLASAETVYGARVREAEERFQAMVKDAEDAGKKIRSDMIEKATIEVAELREESKRRIIEEKELMFNEVRTEAKTLVEHSVKKILMTVADAETTKLLIVKAESELKGIT